MAEETTAFTGRFTTGFYFPLPNLTDKFYRIVVGKIFDQEEWNLKRDAANAIFGREILIRFDYNDGEILLLDYTNCTITLLSKLRLNVNGHSSKFKEVHIISKFGGLIFNWAKPVLPSKLASRIKVHDSIEALARILPLNCLPKDYGGELKSVQEFIDDFDRIYANHREDIIGYINTKSREELRQGGYVEEEMQGTFKQLNID
ncbi:hypothetical protein WA026_021789 [Henosepilachna vigintioctopunctata]|uniref:CRAL-TRIO domain-containing protein n=1 Tax=Henosepilachna vigintioctopunctata TaxID=420089 RepID=A0AAW1TXI3_9CUCU